MALSITVTSERCTGCNHVRFTDQFGVFGPWRPHYLVADAIVHQAEVTVCEACERADRALAASRRLLLQAKNQAYALGFQNLPEIVP